MPTKLCVMIWIAAAAWAGPRPIQRMTPTGPLRFEEGPPNAQDGLRYIARGTGLAALLYDDRAEMRTQTGDAVSMRLLGANRDARWDAATPSSTVSNYYLGNKPESWRRNVVSHSRIARRQVYSGVDLVFHGVAQQLEYDFVVAPGADPASIRILFDGARALHVDPGGDLVIETASARLIQKQPFVYQELAGGRGKVEGEWVRHGEREVGFRIGSYDRDRALTIDPLVTFSSFAGGSGDDEVAVVAVNTLGELVVAGTTRSLTVTGEMRAAPGGGGADGFVMAVTAAGIVRFVTYFGGSGDDRVRGGSEDGGVICGDTSSEDFPFVSRSGSSRYGGGATDAFVVAVEGFSPAAGWLSLAASFGGSGEDRAWSAAGSRSFPLIAGETTSPDLPAANGPLGGVDAFYATFYPFGPVATYVGGSGDDRAFALVRPHPDEYYLAGETTSVDFPVANPIQRENAGGKDGFLFRLGPPAEQRFSTYLGGSGDDSIRALALGPFGRIGAAGTTQSEDFPLHDPVQNQRRGPSDAFFTVLNSERTGWDHSTYFGGFGSETGAAVAFGLGRWSIAGATTSADLLTADAVQPGLGGGTDGYLLGIATGYQLVQSTYYGGSGHDEILALTAGFDGLVAVGGITSSANLAQQSAFQVRQQGSDGFIAVLGNSRIDVPSPGVGKDMQVRAQLGLGTPAGPGGLQITVTSNHPDRLRVSASETEVGQTRLSLRVEEGQRTAQIFFQGLAPEGEASYTVTAPGFEPASGTVRFGPAEIQIQENARLVRSEPLIVESEGLTGILVWPVVPLTGGSGYRQLPGPGRTTDFTFQLDNPELATVSLGFGELELRGLKAGSGELLVRFPSLGLSRRQPVEVRPLRFILRDQRAGKNLTHPAAVQFTGRLRPPPVVRLTSSDPERLLLSEASDEVGAASVAVPYTGRYSFHLHGLTDSGTARVELSSPGYEPVTATIALAPSGFYVAESKPGWVSEPVPVRISVAQLNPQTREPESFGTIRPGVNRSTVMLSSSNPAAGSLAATRIEVGPGLFPSTEFRPTAPGETELTVTQPEGFTAPAASPSKIRVQGATLTLAGAVVGKDLATTVSLRFNSKRAGVTLVTVRSADPSRVRIGAGEGAASIEIPVPGDQLGADIPVVGLGAEGEVELTASAPGYPPASARVRLLASGVATDVTRIDAVAGRRVLLRLRTAVLDPVTRAPGIAQPLRPGIEGLDVDVTTPDATVAELPVTRFRVTNQGTEVALVAGRAGTTLLRLSVPQGFTALGTGSEIPVSVRWPRILLGRFTIGRNQQTRQILVNELGPVQSEVTLTSSDPARLLLSADPRRAGSGQVRVRGEVFLQAIAGSGSVTLRAEAENMEPSSVEVSLSDARFAFAERSVEQFLGRESKTVSVALLDPFGRPGPLRGGSSPITIEIENSNTSVAEVLPNRLVFEPGEVSKSVAIRPTGAGVARLRMSAPDGLVWPASSEVAVSVRQPRLRLPDFTLGRDLQLGFRIDSDVPLPAGITVRVTSSDPSRVLLSRFDDEEGTASVLYRGTTYAQALSAGGVVTLRAEADGFEPATATITLSESELVTTPFVSSRVRLGAGQSRFADLAMRPIDLPGSATGVYALRPGAQLSVDLAAAPPGIVAIGGSPLRSDPRGFMSGFTITGVAPGSARITFRSTSTIRMPEALDVTVTPP